MAPTVASNPVRTPKTGLLRKWILMDNRKKILLVAAVAILSFATFRNVFFTETQHTYSVAHVLTAEEKEALKQEILREETAKHQAQLQALQDKYDESRDHFNKLLEEELGKAVQDKKKIDDLKTELAKLDKDFDVKTEAEINKFKSEIDGIVSLRLAQKQKELIESRADEMLQWFCGGDIDNSAQSTPVTESPIDLYDHPCIGVASEGDSPVPLRRFSMSSPDVSRAIALQLMSSLTNRTDGSGLPDGAVLANFQFNPQRPERCCDDFLFGVHPVFGMFYKINLPYVSSQSEEESGEEATDDSSGPSVTVRTSCFRRKFHPRPVIRPLTPDSNIAHLKDPKLLPRAPTGGSDARLLKEDVKPTPAAEFVAGTVHVILPFRASHLTLLPSLLKNLGRVKAYTTVPFRLIVAPVNTEGDYSFDVLARLREMLPVASAALEYNISLATPLADGDQTKAKLHEILADMIDASTVPPFTDVNAPVANGLLPNPYIAALLGALKLVPRARAPVLILDSATYSVPNDIVKKVLWRIVNGRMVYAPIVSTFSEPDTGLLLGNGNIAFSDEELLQGDANPKFKSALWWQDIGGIGDRRLSLRGPRRLTKLKSKPVARKLVVKPVKSSSETSSSEEDPVLVVDPADAWNHGRGGKRRLLESPIVPPQQPAPTRNRRRAQESAASAAEADADEDDDYNDDDLDTPYGYEDDPLRDEDFESDYEWDGTLDPELIEETEELYGVGDGLADDDTYDNGDHAYYVPDDSNYEDDDLADDADDDDAEGGDDDDGDYSEDEDLYEGYDGDVASALNNRMTVLGATKSDVASMLYRVFDISAPADSTDDLGMFEADNCILRRMLAAGRQDGFRIVRTVVTGYVVDADLMLDGSDDDETFPCSCDNNPSQSHCLLVLPQSTVDDDVDEDRVNCVLTSLLASSGSLTTQQAATIKEEGASHDIDVATLVSVAHEARFVKPSVGIEIVAKLFGANTSPASGTAPLSSSPEVFAFQWMLSSRIRLLEDASV